MLDQTQFPVGMAEDENGFPIPKVKVSGLESNSIQPIDIQSRLAQTIQTHNAVSVGASSSSAATNWIDCDGFQEIALTLLNDSATTSQMDIQWSNDGVNIHGREYGVCPSNTTQYKASSTPTKARYAKPLIYNGDTVAHTMSAWAYLKA